MLNDSTAGMLLCYPPKLHACSNVEGNPYIIGSNPHLPYIFVNLCGALVIHKVNLVLDLLRPAFLSENTPATSHIMSYTRRQKKT